MRQFRDAPKRPINLSLNSAVVAMAKEMGLNISQVVDDLLTQEMQRRHWERWTADNQAAIEHYNTRIEREGMFSDKHRTFMRPGKQRNVA